MIQLIFLMICVIFGIIVYLSGALDLLGSSFVTIIGIFIVITRGFNWLTILLLFLLLGSVFTKFKSDYKKKPPIEFNILVLSTKKEYDNFIKIFDIMLSDNINKKFFEGKLDLIEFTNKEGTKKKDKGTITLFKEWLGEIGVSPDTIKKTIKIINKVRSERSKPSHNIRDNEFDIKYIQKQNKIVLEVYNTFRLLIDELSRINQIKVKHSKWYVENRIAIQSLDEIKNEDNENYQLKICQSK